MYTVNRTYGSGAQFADINVTINSINNISPAILFKHNKFIMQIDVLRGNVDGVRIVNNAHSQTLNYKLYGQRQVVVDLTDFISWTNNNLDVLRIFFSINGSYVASSINIRYITMVGKSYPFRKPINVHRYVVSGDDTMSVFSPFAGKIHYGNDEEMIIYEGLNEVSLSDVGYQWYLTDDSGFGTFDETFDYTFRPTEIHSYEVNVEELCPCKKQYAVIEYLNYLGENVKLLGYVTNIENSVEGENYRVSNTTIYNRQTNLNVANAGQVITVIIPNINYQAYPTDIMLNESVKLTINGTTYQCSPIADSVETTDEYQDYEINFKIV